MKILVSDFDYTFFTLSYKENIDAVQQFVAEDENNMFIIATGRNLKQVLIDLEGLYVPYFFLICNDGALIYNRKNELLYENEIPKEVVKPIFERLDSCRFLSEAYIDTGTEYTIDTEEKAIKMIAKPLNYKKTEKFLTKLLSDFPEVDGYISENWINITSKEASKGNAISILTDKFHLNKEDVYVIGDGVNDLSMFEEYKGYAITDAVDIIKEKAIDNVSTFKELIEKIKDKGQA